MHVDERKVGWRSEKFQKGEIAAVVTVTVFVVVVLEVIVSVVAV